MNVAVFILAGVTAVCIDSIGGDTNRPFVDFAKYDLNQNGKIDVNERKPYVQALARQRREEAKAFAAQQPVLTPQERMFYRPPHLTPELLKEYDTNHSGKLDFDERLKVAQDAAESAKVELRRFDANKDGKLDKEEVKAVHQAQQAEREARLTRSRQSLTNAVPPLAPK